MSERENNNEHKTKNKNKNKNKNKIQESTNEWLSDWSNVLNGCGGWGCGATDLLNLTNSNQSSSDSGKERYWDHSPHWMNAKEGWWSHANTKHVKFLKICEQFLERFHHQDEILRDQSISIPHKLAESHEYDEKRDEYNWDQEYEGEGMKNQHEEYVAIEFERDLKLSIVTGNLTSTDRTKSKWVDYLWKVSHQYGNEVEKKKRKEESISIRQNMKWKKSSGITGDGERFECWQPLFRQPRSIGGDRKTETIKAHCFNPFATILPFCFVAVVFISGVIIAGVELGTQLMLNKR